MNASRIRGFLLQLPKPHVVRVTGDGEPQELKPGKSYAKLADTIVALGPDLIECLDAAGKVLRATRLGSEESQRSAAAETPQVIANDPHAAMLTHFANLLHRAYEHSTEIAFSKMVDVFDIMNQRSESIERRLERSEAEKRSLLQDQVDDALDRAQEVAAAAASGESGDFGSQLLGSFVSAAASGKANGAAKPPPNGKGSS